MPDISAIEVEVTFLSHENGGRRQSPQIAMSSSGSHYMPHVVVDGGDGAYLGVRFVAGPTPLVEVPARFTLELMYAPNVDYKALRPGATFSVREGNKTVAFGRVFSAGIRQ